MYLRNFLYLQLLSFVVLMRLAHCTFVLQLNQNKLYRANSTATPSSLFIYICIYICCHHWVHTVASVSNFHLLPRVFPSSADFFLVKVESLAISFHFEFWIVHLCISKRQTPMTKMSTFCPFWASSTLATYSHLLKVIWWRFRLYCRRIELSVCRYFRVWILLP